MVAKRQLLSISGEPVSIPDGKRLIHLQLRRFAGCPICSLHLHAVAERHDDIVAAGVREVVVFHSTAEELLAHGANWPFDVVADPDRRLYREFGVEPSARALLDPRAWPPTVRSLLRAAPAILAEGRSAPSKHPLGGRLGLPADILIDGDGRVLAGKQGSHAYDQWSVDEVLGQVRSASGTS
jgi:hypothetical protein